MNSQRFPSHITDFLSQLVILLSLDVTERQSGALLGKQPGRGSADPARGSCDERSLSIQSSHDTTHW